MMKKLLLLLFLLPVLVSAQKTTPGNYTYVAQKYEWDAGIFKGLGLPAGPGPAAFIPGQVPRAGALYYDSSGVDEGFYKWTGLSWQLVGSGEVTQSALDDTAAAIRADFPTTPGIDAVLAQAQALTANRTITAGTNVLSVTGSSASGTINATNTGIGAVIQGTAVSTGTGLYGISDGGTGVRGSSNTGVGIFGQSTTTESGSFETNVVSTNTVQGILHLIRGTIGTAANGIGGSIRFSIERDNGATNSTTNEIISKYSTAADGSRTSEVDIKGEDNTAAETFMNIQKDLVRINNNADTLATQAYARSAGGGSGSGTVTNVATGYGVSGGPITTTGTIVADTTSADGLVSKDRLAATIALIDTSNLDVDSTAGDIQTYYSQGDTTLVLKSLKNTYGVNWSTDTDSALLATLDTFLIATKDRVTQVADSLGALIGEGGGTDTWTMNVMTINIATITDAITRHFGYFPAAWHTTATIYEIEIPRNCTLKRATVEGQFTTAGSGEDWSMYVRVDNTTDYLISTLGVSTLRRTWTNAAMNTTGITLTAGQKIVIKSVGPTYATDPANGIFAGVLTFEN